MNSHKVIGPHAAATHCNTFHQETKGKDNLSIRTRSWAYCCLPPLYHFEFSSKQIYIIQTKTEPELLAKSFPFFTSASFLQIWLKRKKLYNASEYSAQGVLRQLGLQLFGSRPGCRDGFSRPGCSGLNPPTHQLTLHYTTSLFG